MFAINGVRLQYKIENKFLRLTHDSYSSRSYVNDMDSRGKFSLNAIKVVSCVVLPPTATFFGPVYRTGVIQPDVQWIV